MDSKTFIYCVDCWIQGEEDGWVRKLLKISCVFLPSICKCSSLYILYYHQLMAIVDSYWVLCSSFASTALNLKVLLWTYFKYLNFPFVCGQHSKLAFLEPDKVISWVFYFSFVPKVIFFNVLALPNLLACHPIYPPTHLIYKSTTHTHTHTKNGNDWEGVLFE